jgi:hypothetical protein
VYELANAFADLTPHVSHPAFERHVMFRLMEHGLAKVLKILVYYLIPVWSCLGGTRWRCGFRQL